MEMWGSKPDTGWGIGQDSAALSMFPLNISLMSMEYQKYINRGFKPLFTR
jgi:hypothetical protein